MFNDYENSESDQKKKYDEFRDYIADVYGLKISSEILNQYKEVYARLYQYQRFVTLMMTNEDTNTLFKYAKEIGNYLESNGQESKYWSDETDLSKLFYSLEVEPSEDVEPSEEVPTAQKNTGRSRGTRKKLTYSFHLISFQISPSTLLFCKYVKIFPAIGAKIFIE